MKKKKLVIFTLAAISTAALSAVACTTEDGHKHSYSVRQGATQHWEQCDCGDKKNYGDHVDLLTNGTQNNTPDGKCDVCDYDVGLPVAKHTVTFDMKGYGEQVEAQSVEEGGKAVKPADPVHTGYDFLGWYADESFQTPFDFNAPVTAPKTVYAHWILHVEEGKVAIMFDMHGHGEQVDAQSVNEGDKATKPDDPTCNGYEFIGWYSDAECTKEFNFDSVLTEDTTIYAKWEKLHVTGDCENDAVILTLNSQRMLAFGDLDKLYFKFTAEVKGRFTLNFANLNSRKCRYTTDKDDDGVYYSAANGVKSVSLEKGESVIIILDCPDGAVANDVKVGLIVNETTDEPLPATGWESGKFASDNGNTVLVFDRDKKQVTLNSSTTPVTYVGGDANVVKFSVDEKNYELKETATGYSLYETFGKIELLLNKVVEAELSDFVGVYQKDGKEICIYASGGGYIKDGAVTNRFYADFEGTRFDTVLCRVVFRNEYNISIVKDSDGATVAVLLNGETYNRTGDPGIEVPQKLPLPDSMEFVGANESINCSYGYQKWKNAYQVNVVDYDGEFYTVKNGNKTYNLKITGTEEEPVIELYISTTLYDTLQVKKTVIKDLVTDGSILTLNCDEFTNNNGFFKVTETGEYKITSLGDQNGSCKNQLFIYIDVPADTKNPNGCNSYDFNQTDTQVVKLTAGTLLCLNIGNFASSSTSASIKVEKYVPEALTMGVGSLTIENPTQNKEYAVTFNAPAAGKYLICGTKTNNGVVGYAVRYSINGTYYGYNPSSWRYEGMSLDNPWVSFEVTEGNLDVPLTIMMPSMGMAIGFEIKPDSSSSKDYTELNVTNGQGSVSASGDYKYTGIPSFADAYGLKFTSDYEFKIVCDGKEFTGNDINAITLSDAQLKMGFTLTTSDQVNYKVVTEPGTETNPYEFTGAGTYNVAINKTQTKIYVSVTAEYEDLLLSLGTFDCFGEPSFAYFIYEGKYYGYDADYNPYAQTELKVPAYSTITVMVGCSNEYVTTKELPVILRPDLSVNAKDVNFAKVEGTDNYTASTGMIIGSNNYHIVSTYGSNVTVTASKNFTVTLGNGTKLTTFEESSTKFTVIIPAGENIYFNINSSAALTVNMQVTAKEGSAVKPYDLTLTDGSFTMLMSSNSTLYFTSKVSGCFMRSYGYAFILTLNGVQLNSVKSFTLEVGDVLVCTNNTAYSSKLELEYSIPDDYVGKEYTYNVDGEDKTLRFGQRALTADGVDYGLKEQNGNVYTFVKYGDDSAIVTVTFGDTLLFGDKTLTEKVEEPPATNLFVYTGNDGEGFSATMTVNEDFTSAEIVTNLGGLYTVTLKLEEDGSYSFSDAPENHNYQSVWGTISADKNSVAYNDGYCTFIMSKH
ncbi:MAG: InlB B-repeat-containing protein [Clostridia bacterium]|nr:InlB B-repeat-containing protein [Clostridia bacterium]